MRYRCSARRREPRLRSHRFRLTFAEVVVVVMMIAISVVVPLVIVPIRECDVPRIAEEFGIEEYEAREAQSQHGFKSHAVGYRSTEESIYIQVIPRIAVEDCI